MGASISIKTVKTEQERRSDGLGEESSGPYRTVDERIVSEEDQTLTLGSGADIVTLLVTRGSTVLLGNRSTIGTVELDDATSFIAPANANIGSITGDVGTLSLGASSSVSLLSASVSGISTIDTKASVTTAFLRTDTLRISPKASIGSGTLHVYEHFEGFIDPKFTGKIVIYGSDRTDISIAGRLCLLGPIRAQ
ncbi:MAG TPA: hypothetical protein PK765_03440 [bacterium]|nr:hypothetical protein [bacterium]